MFVNSISTMKCNTLQSKPDNRATGILQQTNNSSQEASSQEVDLSAVAEWPTPSNPETLGRKLGLQPLICGPLLMKSSCNREKMMTSKKAGRFSSSCPALSVESFMFSKAQSMSWGEEESSMVQSFKEKLK